MVFIGFIAFHYNYCNEYLFYNNHRRQPNTTNGKQQRSTETKACVLGYPNKKTAINLAIRPGADKQDVLQQFGFTKGVLNSWIREKGTIFRLAGERKNGKGFRKSLRDNRFVKTAVFQNQRTKCQKPISPIDGNLPQTPGVGWICHSAFEVFIKSSEQ